LKTAIPEPRSLTRFPVPKGRTSISLRDQLAPGRNYGRVYDSDLDTGTITAFEHHLPRPNARPRIMPSFLNAGGRSNDSLLERDSHYSNHRAAMSYLAQNVEWRVSGDARLPWEANVHGQHWQVRKNKFPEDLYAYSLLIDGVLAESFNLWPSKWVQPP
jgi:hypothetical protein